MIWGDDFAFEDAARHFKSLDNIITTWNGLIFPKTNMEMIYSTPSIYIDAIAKQNITWSTKYDDMFPYADCELCYWTGFFTTRANDKKYMRDASFLLQS